MMIDNKRLMTLLYNAIDVIRELYCAEDDSELEQYLEEGLGITEEELKEVNK
jgi:hypothetical protein